MHTRHLRNVVEILYLALMLRWQRTAPPDRHAGLLDGKPERNTQTSRLAYALIKIAAGNEEKIYGLLEACCRRCDGKSYFSQDPLWMIEPYALARGWYFEGCTSLKQKQGFMHHLTKLGLSPRFVACLDDFIANKDVHGYMPSLEEQDEIVSELERQELCHA